MGWSFARCGILLAVLLGSQSHHSHSVHPAILLVVSTLVGPLAPTTPSIGIGTAAAAVVRAALTLPTATCASPTNPARHQHHPRHQQRQHDCASSRQQHEELHLQRRRGRRRHRQLPMAHLSDAEEGPPEPEALPSPASRAAPLPAGNPSSASAAPSLEALRSARPSVGSGLELDARHMRRALELAAKGLGHTRPNPAVGCVILDKDGVVAGEGFHPRAGEPHAEVWAIRQAGERARGGTAYVTLEPCNHFGRTPPCTTALLKSGVSRVVAGMVDPDPRTAGSGLRRLAEAGIDVSVGVEGGACQALNSAFVHRVAQKSCYGVLHCSLDSPSDRPPGSPEGLMDTTREADLTVPPDGRNYDEYDAVVVEGRSGVAKLEACLAALPPTALRVVIVGVGVGSGAGGLEEELREVLESPVWTDSPERTIVVSPADANGARRQERNASPTHSVRASLKARGVIVVDFHPPTTPSALPPLPPLEGEHEGTTTQSAAAALSPETAAAPPAAAAAASAVSRELYRRGMLSAAWEVSPALAAVALQGGHIQRALVRRRESSLRIEGAGLQGGAAAAAGLQAGVCQVPERRKSPGVQDDNGSGFERGEEDEEEAVLRVLRRLAGSVEGVRLRRGDRVFPWGAPRESCIEVLLPNAETLQKPPAST